ncbi:ArsR family transcriptional regulator [Priestia aryabhattai]|uniref:ArsR/SmtB family transcription factor n=1 Tax=Priestia TaxID=2800373 RepID=UPI000B514521|nr:MULTISPECIES: metalloregulator ArsR/SmtB family transcription factor [Priestia]MBX9967922.1 winged helix-turn-helix transcriptional regulator [Priestia aryabhattai]MBY0029302.1 winged helix-turn-helix transcriptional regulator [Priestia aryabhattai]MBZ6486599.1 winged helix-turn-helix transcriptional regulator [Priestia aryabhattai]MDH3132116.1 metalloregulator ArsR/SmtB family transcription factor [Priestia aryabhattai]OVE35170.1 transcriptional regulator [Priestia aryabhattai]
MDLKLLDDQMRVQIFKALSDESRIAIVRTLYQSGRELSCGEVGERCNILKTTASYHFKTLREAKLTTVRKDARTKYVKLNLETFEKYIPNFLETL